MALTVNWESRIIDSSGSITDLPAFHAELRDLEDSATGAIYPVTHSWKALDLGGAFFYGLELLNGYQLRFPTPGNYTIQGNLGGVVVPVAGVYVERKTSAAYTTTSLGGSGPSAADIAAAVWQQATRTLTSGEGSGGATAADIWTYMNRTLTSGSSLAPTALENAAAIRTELAAELANMDAAVSTRIATGTVVKANVLAIKDQTVLGDGTKDSPWRPA